MNKEKIYCFLKKYINTENKDVFVSLIKAKTKNKKMMMFLGVLLMILFVAYIFIIRPSGIRKKCYKEGEADNYNYRRTSLQISNIYERCLHKNGLSK